MAGQYVEKRDSGYYIIGSRISLDTVVYAFNRGSSSGEIQHSYPSLSLEEINDAVEYYLENKAHIDRYLAGCEIEYEKEKARINGEFEKASPELSKRLRKAREIFHAHMTLETFDAAKFEELLRQNGLR